MKLNATDKVVDFHAILDLKPYSLTSVFFYDELPAAIGIRGVFVRRTEYAARLDSGVNRFSEVTVLDLSNRSTGEIWKSLPIPCSLDSAFIHGEYQSLVILPYYRLLVQSRIHSVVQRLL